MYPKAAIGATSKFASASAKVSLLLVSQTCSADIITNKELTTLPPCQLASEETFPTQVTVYHCNILNPVPNKEEKLHDCLISGNVPCLRKALEIPTETLHPSIAVMNYLKAEAEAEERALKPLREVHWEALLTPLLVLLEVTKHNFQRLTDQLNQNCDLLRGLSGTLYHTDFFFFKLKIIFIQKNLW